MRNSAPGGTCTGGPPSTPLTAVRRNPQGATAAMGIDFVVPCGGWLFIAGWHIGCGRPRFVLPGEPDRLPKARCSGRARTIDFSGVEATGFLMAIELGDMDARPGRLIAFESRDTAPPLVVELATVEAAPVSALIEHALNHHDDLTGLLFACTYDQPACAARLSPHLPAAAADAMTARGALKSAAVVPGVGGIIVGWAARGPNTRLLLVDERGNRVEPNSDLKWHRDDVEAALQASFGDWARNAGFVAVLRASPKPASRLWLIAVTADTAVVLSQTLWSEAPAEPQSFVRVLGETRLPADRLCRLFDRGAGGIIETLSTRASAHGMAGRPECIDCGPPVAAPRCTVVIPVAGSGAFMADQLLEFAGDPDFAASVEVIYAVRDPKFGMTIAAAARTLHKASRFPFRLMIPDVPCRSAPAINAAARMASAPHVLLLGETVMPIAAGWLQSMLAVLTGRDDVGAVGARLLAYTEAPQNMGLDFVWDEDCQTYSIRQRASCAAGSGDDKASIPAISSACLLMSAAIFTAVGGLDESYFGDDFAAADLCLKLRGKRLSPVLCHGTALVDLEKPGPSPPLQTAAADVAAVFDAWQLTRQWKPAIKALACKSGSRAP